MLAISPSRAAESVVALTSERLTPNGQYYDQRRPSRRSAPSYDALAASRLWTITEQICGPFEAGVRSPELQVP